MDIAVVEAPMLGDTPPDGRTIIDPPQKPKMTPGGYGKPKATEGICGWDDMGTPCE